MSILFFSLSVAISLIVQQISDILSKPQSEMIPDENILFPHAGSELHKQLSVPVDYRARHLSANDVTRPH